MATISTHCIKSELKITVGHRPFSDHYQGIGQVNPIFC